MLEVIATSVADAKTAEKNGADRIELVMGIVEGGLTPSYGLIKRCVQTVSIPVHVMIRPHSRSFCYNEEDMRTMVDDVHVVRELGAAGIVCGALTEERKVDVHTLQGIVEHAQGLSVTFHRAFDEVDNQEEALATLAQFPEIHTILTSGGMPRATDAIPQMKRLVSWSKHTHLAIMAGSGLNATTITSFMAQTGVHECHVGKAVRVNEQATAPIDPQKVAQLKRCMLN